MIYIDTDIEGFDLARALNEISPQRRAQALGYRRDTDRRLSVMAYRLLQRALREEYAITKPPVLDYLPGGKPVIAGHPEIHFNLSHCRGGAVCAVSDHPVGADLETLRPFKEALARYIFCETDYRRMADSERPDEAFTRLWTVKEALGKLTGKGLGGSFQQPTVTTDSPAEWQVKTVGLPASWSGVLSFEDLETACPAIEANGMDNSHKIYLSVCQSAR